jgi:ribonuclease J
VRREGNVSEHEVYENGLKAIANSKSLVIADFSPRDIDRLLTFLQIARDSGRKLVILPKGAYLRLHNWLNYFGLRGFGLPVENNGEWQIPDGEKGLHASGIR